MPPARSSSRSHLHAGKNVHLFFDGDDHGGGVGERADSREPAKWARVLGTTGSWTGYFGAVVLIFPLVGAAVLVSPVRSRRRAIRAFTAGTPVVAKVIQIGLDRSVLMMGRHPTQVVWQFQINGRSYRGSVSSMDSLLVEPLARATEVIVLYDPADPRVNSVFVE